MEAEERPNKIRKLDTAEINDAHNSNDVQPLPECTTSTSDEPAVEIVIEDYASEEEPNDDNKDNDSNHLSSVNASAQPSQQMSKNQMKKQRKKEAWEAGRDYRKAKRKEKTQARKARKRAVKEGEAQISQNNTEASQGPARIPRPRRPIRLPVAIVIDCGFDDLMVDKERISLGSQLTRSYSDVHRAAYPAHLYISSWGGLLKERFETVLSGHYKNWKDIVFTEQDFVGAAEQARQAMQAKRGGRLVAAFEKYAASSHRDCPGDGTTKEEPGVDTVSATKLSGSGVDNTHLEAVQPNGDNTQRPEEATSAPVKDIVYLSSESPHTLTSLSPHHIYVVGGLVDKNRHKGICYKTACDRGVRTAKLPIGEYMEMTSRFVLATNHVVEIMLKWLECGDWGQAFLQVMPKRKGGKLRAVDQQESGEQEDFEEQSSSNEQPGDCADSEDSNVDNNHDEHDNTREAT